MTSASGEGPWEILVQEQSGVCMSPTVSWDGVSDRYSHEFEGWA